MSDWKLIDSSSRLFSSIILADSKNCYIKKASKNLSKKWIMFYDNIREAKNYENHFLFEVLHMKLVKTAGQIRFVTRVKGLSGRQVHW